MQDNRTVVYTFDLHMPHCRRVCGRISVEGAEEVDAGISEGAEESDAGMASDPVAADDPTTILEVDAGGRSVGVGHVSPGPGIALDRAGTGTEAPEASPGPKAGTRDRC
jgi:hypothetical protein